MTAFVIDASVALKWFLPESDTARARSLLQPDNVLNVPDLVFPEVGNTLWKRCRRRELEAEAAFEMVDRLVASPLRVHPTARLLEAAMEVATRTGASVYDATYVALAVALGIRLVTADRRLVNALATTPLRTSVAWIGSLS